MIRFIDLTGQINEGKEFAFFNTVNGKFITYSDCQTWDSIEDFETDFKMDGDLTYAIERFFKLIPTDFFIEP